MSENVFGVYLVGSRRRKLFVQCPMDGELYFFLFILSLLSMIDEQYLIDLENIT